MSETPYLREIDADAVSQRSHRLEEIKQSILRDGFWEERSEWRISTVTTSRIEPEFAHDKWWFRVSVACDHEMVCHTSTLDRAVEFTGVYEELAMDLFWTLGWPSWAANGRLDPQPDEMVADPPTP